MKTTYVEPLEVKITRMRHRCLKLWAKRLNRTVRWQGSDIEGYNRETKSWEVVYRGF
jgi:hypothetical protein